MIRLFVVLLWILTVGTKAVTTDLRKSNDCDFLMMNNGDSLIVNQFADYYLVVVESNKNYALLREIMFNIHQEFRIEIDTLGRYYNKETHQIVLPDNDDDEIYRGTYFPRRFESETLSIENAYIYQENALEPAQYPTEMILVAGMYEKKSKADSLQKALKLFYPVVSVQKSKVYIGCMH